MSTSDVVARSTAWRRLASVRPCDLWRHRARAVLRDGAAERPARTLRGDRARMLRDHLPARPVR